MRSGIVLEIEDAKVMFDCKEATNCDLAFISHSHLDHVPKVIKSKAYATPETISLIGARRKHVASKIKPLPFWQSVKLDDICVTAVPSGHILGAASFIMDTPVGRILYSGDINVYPSITVEHTAVKPEDVDYLIVEATYGVPIYKFGKPSNIWVDIVEWVLREVNKGFKPCFNVYTVGKAQEVIGIINCFTDLKVEVNYSIARVNTAYKRFGIELDYVREEGDCIVTSGGWVNKRNIAPAIATGFAVHESIDGVKGFPLSSHADYPGLISYVKEIKPKKVFTVYGYSIEFAEIIKRKLGIKAHPLGETSIVI